MGECKPEVGKHGKFQSCGCMVRKSKGRSEGLLHTSWGHGYEGNKHSKLLNKSRVRARLVTGLNFW